jgi:site-specific DNA recombinase
VCEQSPCIFYHAFGQRVAASSSDRATASRQGRKGCRGYSIPVEKLDTLVTDHLVEHLFQPERLTELLASVCAPRADKQASVDARAARLQTELTEAEEKLRRLYKLVEDGLADLDDILRERISTLKLTHANAKAALDRVRATTPATVINPELV